MKQLPRSKFPFWLVALGLVSFLVSLVARSASADGLIFPPPGGSVIEAAQKALIVHQDGIEDLVVSVEFYGDAKDFGWVVPVPEKPVVKRGKNELFTALGKLTEPKRNLLERIKNRRRLGPIPLMSGEMGSLGMDEEEVRVLETQKVGILEVTTLAAAEPKALEEWLHENGYRIPREEEEAELGQVNRSLQILQDYIDEGWFFVAAKIRSEFLASGQKGESGGDRRLARSSTGVGDVQVERRSPGRAHIAPLHLRFKTKKIVYPMKISSLSRRAPSVLLYVLTDGKVEVLNYNRSGVSSLPKEERSLFRTSYAGSVEAEFFSEWLPEVKDGYLTKLYAKYVPLRQMDEDLRFGRAESERDVGTGEMSKGDWLQVPLYLLVYGPARLARWSLIFSADPVLPPRGGGFFLRGVFFLLSLGAFGFLWTAGAFLVLRKTRKRVWRILIYGLQFPGIWLWGNFLSVACVLGYLALMSLVKVDAETKIINTLLANNIGAVFFAVLTYRLQASVHRFLKSDS